MAQPAIPLTSKQCDMVTAHLPLVRRVARALRRGCPSSIELDDLHQMGCIGLMAAVRGFDASRSVPFELYARVRITGAIVDGLRAGSWSRGLRKARRDGSESAQLSLHVAALDALTAGAPQVALRVAPTLVAVLARAARNPESSALDAHTVQQALSVLTPRERRVIEHYHLHEHHMEDIGRGLGISESRVSQLRRQALRKMRGALSPPTTLQKGNRVCHE